MTALLISLAVALLVGAAAGWVVWPALVRRAEHHRRARLVREARADLRDLARQASRARYDLITRRNRQ